MSLIHVYGDLNSLYSYIVKDIIGDNEAGVSMSEVMFDTGETNVIEEDDDDNWHDTKESDGKLMRWFKKFDKTLGVGEE